MPLLYSVFCSLTESLPAFVICLGYSKIILTFSFFLSDDFVKKMEDDEEEEDEEEEEEERGD